MPTVRCCEIVSRLKDDNGKELFSLDRLKEVISEKSHVIDRWAYIIHDKDTYTESDEKRNPQHKQGTLKPEHIHLLLHFKREQPQNTKYIAKWFDLTENFISKIRGKFDDAVCYLAHRNAPDKYQYPTTDVVSNFNVETIIENVGKQNKLEDILQRILSGEIREYNKSIEINNRLLCEPSFARRVDLAFNVRAEHLQATQQERHTTVYYICGKSGSGKTTLAKRIAESRKLDYFISSGSNDVMDGYAQQPVLILDDIRPSSMGLSDLLKLLDPHTASSVKSRYKNKYLNAEIIILTSVLPINDFYHNVFEHENEPITQLKRRCQYLIEMDTDIINVRRWDNLNMCYSKPEIFPNLVLLPYQTQAMSDTMTTREHIEQDLPFITEIPKNLITETTENTKNTENTENTENTKSSENTENTENSENPKNSETEESNFQKILFGEE